MDNFGHLDWETRSVLDLEEVGLDVYLSHPSTKIIMANYCRGDRAVKTWEPHLHPELPAELEDILLDPFCTLYAWGSNFERQVALRLLGIDKPVMEWVCVMSAARYAGIPGKLDEASKVLKLGVESKLDGNKLIKMFCEPVDVGGADTLFGISDPTFNTPYTHSLEWKQFCKYGIGDIVAERAALKKIRPFWPSEEEWETWRLDAKINQTGWPVDLLLVQNAREIALRTREPLLARMKELSGLANVESRNQVLNWAQDRGYLFDSLGKDFIARALAGECDLTPEGKEMLELRLQTAKSSISKYTALADMTAADARLRYQYTYYGAHTGRWCIAEDTPVTVKTGEGIVKSKSIQNVLLTDLVWDGEEWVAHDGVVFSGDKETISYEGVAATPEHEVWVSPTKKVSLREAKDKELALWKGKPPYEIYRLTSPSGKSYIGLTNMGTSERWRKHILRAFNENRNHPLYNAIRKYGAESFIVETIDYALSKRHAQRLETEYIAKHPKHLLYNISPGGEADGETGAAVFWKRMEENPKEKEAYKQKLSETQIARGSEAHAHLPVAAQAWKDSHPKEAYKMARRAVRMSPSHKNPKKADNRPLIEKLRWKHDRPKATSIMKKNWWDNASKERKAEIAKNVSNGKKKQWASLSSHEQEAGREYLRGLSATMDRSIQGPAASRGLKKFWEDLRKDPVRYKEYIDSRAKTLKQTLKVKYANV